MMGPGPWAKQLGQEFTVHRGEGVALIDVGLLWGPGSWAQQLGQEFTVQGGEGIALIDVGLRWALVLGPSSQGSSLGSRAGKELH